MKASGALRALLRYLSDWRNWLTHGLVGVALVAIPLILPLPLWGRLLAFAAIVALNVLRMKIDKRRKAAKAAPAPTATD